MTAQSGSWLLKEPVIRSMYLPSRVILYIPYNSIISAKLSCKLIFAHYHTSNVSIPLLCLLVDMCRP